MFNVSDEFFCVLDKCCVSRDIWTDNLPPCVDCEYCVSQMSIEEISIG